jgi:RPA family protein
MVEQRKREIAFKLRIGDILAGTPIVEEAQVLEKAEMPNETFQSNAPRERFRFLELKDKKIVRVNVIANVVEVYHSDGEKKYASVTVDDSTGQIRLKAFGDSVDLFKDLTGGDSIVVIGVLRIYNGEIYISPEIIKKVDTRYLLIRKMEIEGPEARIVLSSKKEELNTREKVISMIKKGDNEGADVENIIMSITDSNPEEINSEITRLLEDGLVYEPRPGKVRWLG